MLSLIDGGINGQLDNTEVGKIKETLLETKVSSRDCKRQQFEGVKKVLDHRCNWFNDQAVDYFIFLMRDSIKNDKVVLLETSFYEQISNDESSIFREEWLSEKEYILIPMTDGAKSSTTSTSTHYFLCFIEVRERAVRCYDSLYSEHQKPTSSPEQKYGHKLSVIQRFFEKQQHSAGGNGDTNPWTISVHMGPIQVNNFDCGVYMLAFMLSLTLGKIPDASFFTADENYITKLRFSVLYSIVSKTLIHPIRRCPPPKSASLKERLESLLANYDRIESIPNKYLKKKGKKQQELVDTTKQADPWLETLLKRIQISLPPTEETENAPSTKGTYYCNRDEIRAWLQIHGVRYASADSKPSLHTKALLATRNYDHVIAVLKARLGNKNSSATDCSERLGDIDQMNNLPSHKNGNHTLQHQKMIKTWSQAFCKSSVQKGSVKKDISQNDDGQTECAAGTRCFFRSPVIHDNESKSCTRCKMRFHGPLCLPSDTCETCAVTLQNGSMSAEQKPASEECPNAPKKLRKSDDWDSSDDESTPKPDSDNEFKNKHESANKQETPHQFSTGATGAAFVVGDTPNDAKEGETDVDGRQSMIDGENNSDDDEYDDDDGYLSPGERATIPDECLLKVGDKGKIWLKEYDQFRYRALFRGWTTDKYPFFEPLGKFKYPVNFPSPEHWEESLFMKDGSDEYWPVNELVKNVRQEGKLDSQQIRTNRSSTSRTESRRHSFTILFKRHELYLCRKANDGVNHQEHLAPKSADDMERVKIWQPVLTTCGSCRLKVEQFIPLGNIRYYMCKCDYEPLKTNLIRKNLFDPHNTEPMIICPSCYDGGKIVHCGILASQENTATIRDHFKEILNTKAASDADNLLTGRACASKCKSCSKPVTDFKPSGVHTLYHGNRDILYYACACNNTQQCSVKPIYCFECFNDKYPLSDESKNKIASVFLQNLLEDSDTDEEDHVETIDHTLVRNVIKARYSFSKLVVTNMDSTQQLAIRVVSVKGENTSEVLAYIEERLRKIKEEFRPTIGRIDWYTPKDEPDGYKGEQPVRSTRQRSKRKKETLGRGQRKRTKNKRYED
jgi:hypothetical protein